MVETIIFIKNSKGRILFWPFKTREQMFIFQTQIVQLLSKWENEAEKWVWVNLSEHGASESPPASIVRPYFRPNDSSAV